MKRWLFATACALAVVFTLPASAFAAASEVDALPDPGMTPASRFYFLESWVQHMALRFTFRAEARVQKALHYAGEKLAEMEKMAEQEQPGHMQQAGIEYGYCLKVAVRTMQRTQTGLADVSEQVAMMTSRHLAMIAVQQNAGNEDCQQIRSQVRETAEVCQETALRSLAMQSPVEAVRLNLSLMAQQCVRMSNCAGQEDDGQTGEALRQYERLRLMNQEIAACAMQLGKGPEAQQMIDSAIATQSGVLSQVRNQLQIGSPDSGETQQQSQIQEQEQYRLGSGGAQAGDSTANREQSGDGSGYAGADGSGSGSGGKR